MALVARAERIVAELEEARRRSLGLCDALSEVDQTKQHSVLMSPLVWDLAHVGNYEDQWLLRSVGAAGLRPDLDDMYDAFRHPRAGRRALPLLPPDAARRYIAAVRDEVIEHLGKIDFDAEAAIVRDGFVYGMVVQHEHQHAETMTATRQLMGETAVPLVGRARPARSLHDQPRGEVFIPGGDVEIGTDLDPWAYDNERPAHRVELAPFFIDVTPVTNRAYTEFVADGGYVRRELWDDEGWTFIASERIAHPGFWQADGASWTVLRFGARRGLDLDEPVQHVSWHEAVAFARWAGKRLPTEFEWECAAAWDGEKKRAWPWGDAPASPSLANLGARHDGPAPVGAYPEGTSPWGCHQMIGDVWEWTSSSFQPYPGFTAFPYREYSEVFFGSDYKVLRGGSWATHETAIRPTFRNWDYAIRRHIFSGFRCARDA